MVNQPLKRKRTDKGDENPDTESSYQAQSSSAIVPRKSPAARRRFEELHPRDRATKTNRKTRIETNWGISIQECIPVKIRPRVELKKGAKIRIGDINGTEEIWWNWSVEVLRALEELSTMMAGRLSPAREIMMMEVSKRQQDPTNPQRRVAELLLGDLQRVVDSVRRHQAEDVANGGVSQQDVSMRTFQELEREPNPAAQKQAQQAQAESYLTFEEADITPDSLSSPTPATGPGHATSAHANGDPVSVMPSASLTSATGRLDLLQPLNATTITFITPAHVIAMRSRSSRLRAKALRLEAEASDLDANLAVAKHNGMA
jgi:hypothetical protein